LEEIINADLSNNKDPPKETIIKTIAPPPIKPGKPGKPIKSGKPPIKPVVPSNTNGTQISSLLLYISVAAFFFLGLSVFLYQKSSTRIWKLKKEDSIRKKKKKKRTSNSANISTFDRKGKPSKPLNKKSTF
jgi:hypothetical protein